MLQTRDIPGIHGLIAPESFIFASGMNMAIPDTKSTPA